MNFIEVAKTFKTSNSCSLFISLCTHVLMQSIFYINSFFRKMHKFRRMQRVKRILLALIVGIVLILIGCAIFIYFIRKGQAEVIEDDFPLLNSTPRSVFVNPLHVLVFDENETTIESPALSRIMLDFYKANLIGHNEARKDNLTTSD